MLTDLQKKKLTRYFRVYDVDDNGSIALPDFERVVENVRALHGVDVTSPVHRGLRDGLLRRWASLAESADSDHDGGVDLGEWLEYWDGVLDADEFCNFYGVYGLQSAVARQVFIDLDLDGDGRVTRQELVAMAHEFYRSDDPHAPGSRLFGPTG